MKLTAKGRYAVMAMADLASFNKQQKPVSLNDISIRQSISLSFLEQLFLKLKNKNLVTSVRGNLGGYKLSKDSNKIYLSSIIEAVNEDIKTTKCKLKSTFKDNLFFEIQRHNEVNENRIENFLIANSKSLKVPIIASQEVFYINQDMHEAHDAYICIQCFLWF